MSFKKSILLSLLAVAMISLLGCVGSESSVAPNRDNFIYRGHDFGPDRDMAFQQGVMDGCKTSDGDYTKNHTAYETDESYHIGWEDGRLHCKGVSAQ